MMKNSQFTTERQIEALVAQGQSRSMAEILAYRRPPGVHGTDTQAFAGCGSLQKQLGKQTERVCKAAMKHGYTPTGNEMYNPTFARFEGDPQAFSSQGQGLGHYIKLAEERGTGLQGDINIAPRAKAPPKKKKLARDLIAKHMQKRFEQNPDLRFTANRRELAEQISEQHGDIRN